MSTLFDKRVDETIKWYTYHANTISDVNMHLRFLDRSVAVMIMLMQQLRDDIQVLEGRGTALRSVGEIVGPGGIDLRKANERS